MGQQFAQLAFGAQFDFGGVILRFQTQASLPSIDACGFSYVADRSCVVDTAELGQQSSRGVEASIGLMLDHGWRIDANTAWLRAKYDDFVQSVNGVAVNYAGNVPVNVPQQVSNIWLTWAFAPNWSVNGGVQIVGKTFADNANTLAHPAYNVVNTGVQWKPDANTTLSLRVYNLFDKIYATSGGTTQWLLGMPRTAELALNVKF